MYEKKIHERIADILIKHSPDNFKDHSFFTRCIANAEAIYDLYNQLYAGHLNGALLFDKLIETIAFAHESRPDVFLQKDIDKAKKENWFTGNELAGMSLYVDRFSESLARLEDKLDFLKDLGINVLHLMPLFQSPLDESDGGYAVSDFRKVDERFGSLDDLIHLQKKMADEDMYLMLDIVLNHTSHQHEWAKKAMQGNKKYQDFFYMYNNRLVPDEFEQTMPEVFPGGAPGNFTWCEECSKWVMTVFHNYQWDLNYSNPEAFIAMLDTIFFYANLGVDILRIDAPAFIWKQTGTTCQNLPQAHTILRLIKLCVQVAAPGMALLGEAIVAPAEIMSYFGKNEFAARECDFAYNATQMALQWDALATGDISVMLKAQEILLQKPYGTSWITYTRSHDDIGLGYDDYMIEAAGYNAYEHRNFLKNYYSGNYQGSVAKGELFAYNPKNNDARISGSLASLCGLEQALENDNDKEIDISVKKILMMQAYSFFTGGLPMVFYGDEVGYTNDYSYLDDDSKSYDNRWMHRPVIDWKKNNKKNIKGTVEEKIFSATKKLINIRKRVTAFADASNITWTFPHNIHVAAFIRHTMHQHVFCVFNFSNETAFLTWYAFRENGFAARRFFDHYTEKYFNAGNDDEYIIVAPYGFHVLEAIK